MTASARRERPKNTAASQSGTPRTDRSLDAYGAIVRQWATGRLPGWARQGTETSDLVQVTLLRAWQHLVQIQDQPEGAFRAYLRRILENEIVDRIRSARRHPRDMDLSEEIQDSSPTPLDAVLEEESLATYRRLLDGLRASQRDVLVLRIEHGQTYAEIGENLGIKPNAARMRAARALAELAETLEANGGPPAKQRPS